MIRRHTLLYFSFQNNICVVKDTCYPISSSECGFTKTEGKAINKTIIIVGAVIGGVLFAIILAIIVLKMKIRNK